MLLLSKRCQQACLAFQLGIYGHIPVVQFASLRSQYAVCVGLLKHLSYKYILCVVKYIS